MFADFHFVQSEEDGVGEVPSEAAILAFVRVFDQVVPHRDRRFQDFFIGLVDDVHVWVVLIQAMIVEIHDFGSLILAMMPGFQVLGFFLSNFVISNAVSSMRKKTSLGIELRVAV